MQSSMRLHTTGSIVGRDVRSRDGSEIGRIEQIGVEPQSGSILFAFVIPFVGYDRLIPVPWERIELTSDGSSAVVDLSRERLLEAPTLERGYLGSWVEKPELARIREYYGLTPEPVRFREAAIPAEPGQRHTPIGSWVAVLIVLLVIVGGVAYLLNERGVAVSANSVKSAASSVRNASLDAATTVKVKAALALSRSVSAYDISVDTNDGVVTLSGAVPSDRIRGLAGEIASDTSGVRSVDNRLAVDPQVQAGEGQSAENRDAPEDLALKAAVERALRGSRFLSGTIIGVRVAQGKVLLEGLVANHQQKTIAEQAVREVDGVEEVENNLTVVGQSPEGPSSGKKMTIQAAVPNMSQIATSV